jgi:micrococcal nuclease
LFWAAASVQFSLCSGSMDTDCVVDGDTIRVKNDKIRLVGFNTPETCEPACPAEAAKGEQAKLRLLELLNSGSLAFAATADRDRDRYGRLLRSVAVNGRDVADILISEGLAEPYQGGKSAIGARRSNGHWNEYERKWWEPPPLPARCLLVVFQQDHDRIRN